MVERGAAINTVSMLGQAYSLLGFQIIEGVVGAGYPQKPKYSAVFAQISLEGTRLTTLARRANMTPQAMGELVDELVAIGYVARRPDPSDGRAKLIVPTHRGRAAIEAAKVTIEGIEDNLIEMLGETGHSELRRLLARLVDEVGDL